MRSHEALPDAMLELVLLGMDSPLCLIRPADVQAVAAHRHQRRLPRPPRGATNHRRQLLPRRRRRQGHCICPCDPRGPSRDCWRQ
ncbi:unnamed protein product [Urochloa humidicola]